MTGSDFRGGGVLRDSHGRQIFTTRGEGDAPDVSDVKGAGTVFDSEGREHIVIVDKLGNPLASGSGLPKTIVSKTANYTAASGERVEADTTSGGFTVTLPSGALTGDLVTVEKTDNSGNTVTVNQPGGTPAWNTLTPSGGAVFQHVGSDVWRIAATLTTSGQPGPPGRTGDTGPAATAVTLTAQGGTAYTLVLADGGTEIEATNGSAVTVTVPPNSAVAFPVGTVINVRQYGAGQVTLAAGAGVTLRSPNGLKSRAQYSTVSLIKRATNEWIVSGDTTV